MTMNLAPKDCWFPLGLHQDVEVYCDADGNMRTVTRPRGTTDDYVRDALAEAIPYNVRATVNTRFGEWWPAAIGADGQEREGAAINFEPQPTGALVAQGRTRCT
jgi:hypothetical protein